ncbi:putative bifunctional diguanylate cyclase/phosphodiesterase [Devosia sp.]|uniref:putative bifunctional diguanylate cyclase/phosphodiesterase n=1 Tax=Devosia sp. TaxID=1871048 RepID=UPI002B0000E7|nr:EAL domain-containing protein [Devosia sp.]
MPALDYVSIIRSVYGDRGAMLAGVFASALTAALTAYRTQSLPLYLIAVAFIIIGTLRHLDMRAFRRAAIDNDDAAAAETWENRAVISGSALALVYGFWCLFAMLLVDDPFAELASVSLSIAVMVGICARNFGLDRLVTLQMLGVILPMSLGFFLHGDIFHPVLAALLLVMLVSYRKLAGDIRSILLSAVHGRIEASRLATELDMAMATLEHGLCMLDERGVVSVANARAVRLFSLIGVPDLIGLQVRDVLVRLGKTQALPSTAVQRLLDMIDKRLSGKVLLCLPARHYYEVSVSSRDQRTVLLFEDISERVASEERINFMARHDALTGLPNRTYFGELVSEDLDARRFGDTQRMASLMIVDIDEFKHVNDTFGHIAGDGLLKQVADRLRDTLPRGAVLARLGGDEFVVYRGAVDSSTQLERDAEALQEAICGTFSLEGLTIAASASIGMATSTDRQDTLDELMTKADLALYAAKGAGKARSQLFHAQMDIDYHYRQRLKTDLREALDTGALTLSFQPLLDMKTGKVVSCEALSRWNHPELGIIPPSTFVPLAEEMGLISDITTSVIRNAAMACAQWPGDVGVTVNISARDFRGSDLAVLVTEALADSGLAPARFEIEVTETAVIEEHDIAHHVLTELAESGIAIALDDFGTGYSSLSYLNALPFTKLKIDRSFVADIVDNSRSLRLLTNVARLGRDLDLIVVAEGVETEEQLDTILAHTAIQQVQGYFFSRPLPQRDIAELITRLNAKRADNSKKWLMKSKAL